MPISYDVRPQGVDGVTGIPNPELCHKLVPGTLVLFGPTLACLRKTFARLTEISKDCGCDQLAALELIRLEKDLGHTLDGCLCKEK